MPMPASPHVVFAIGLAVLAMFLYTRDKVPLETTSLLIILVVLGWFELFPFELRGDRVRARDVFGGFGNEALVTVVALLVLARSLEVTRALLPIGQVLARLWRLRPKLALLATMLTALGLSMFLNNTPVVAALMPLLVAVSLKAGTPASGMLMPVGFATIVGGMATTIGTSTNLLVVQMAVDLGLREFRMFDFVAPVLAVGLVAILYLWLVAPHLVPDRRPPMSSTSPRVFDSRLRISADSAVAGKTLSEAIALTQARMKVSGVLRGELALVRLPSLTLLPGDCLQVTDTLENLHDFERRLAAVLLPLDAEHGVDTEHPLASDQRIAEVVVMRGSMFDQATFSPSQVLSHYGLRLLAVHRAGAGRLARPPGSTGTVLHPGDVIVVQGAIAAIDALKASGRALVLDGNVDLPRPAMASTALLIMAGVVVSAAFGVLRISQAAVLGVGLMLLTHCLTWADIRDAVDRRIVLVIAASLALGIAMTATGAADFVAQVYVALFQGMPTVVLLSGLMLVMALLTEIITNNAIAVLGTPIAISIANALGAPAEPFVLAVLFGANMSYLTPVGYQTNLLVMSAGGYRFSDFVRVGAPLQLIMWLGLSIALPIFYDL